MEQQYLYGQHPYQQPEQDFTSYHPYPILPSPQLSRHHQHQYSHERRSHHHPMGCRSSSRWRIPQEQVQIQIREDAYQLQQPLEVVLEKRKYALRSREEMDHIFHLCCSDKWPVVLNHVQQNPGIALTPITMGNNITTTILHQAITKRAKKVDRVQLIFMILQQTPDAAAIRNGYGSLPLHAIGQRNIGIDSNTKEQLIRQLVHAYPSSVAEPGGVGKRTPLHIIFTDYYSPRLTKELINIAPNACFMRDKKGYLPAHVACSRHCSPEKLRMLLEVHPHALFEKTNDNHTLLSLAEETSTPSHPNHSLIEELHRQMEVMTTNSQNSNRNTPLIDVTKSSEMIMSPNYDSIESDRTYERMQTDYSRDISMDFVAGDNAETCMFDFNVHENVVVGCEGTIHVAHCITPSSTLVDNAITSSLLEFDPIPYHNTSISKKRKAGGSKPPPTTRGMNRKKSLNVISSNTATSSTTPADLLLHFSRTNGGVGGMDELSSSTFEDSSNSDSTMDPTPTNITEI